MEVEFAITKRKAEIADTRRKLELGLITFEEHAKFMLEEKPLDIKYNTRTSQVKPPKLII